jgi:hypothetical protein
MTKVQVRFRLERPLDVQMMPRIAWAHSVYGIMHVEPQPSTREILVDYDASRLRKEDVGAVFKRAGIAVEPEK